MKTDFNDDLITIGNDDNLQLFQCYWVRESCSCIYAIGPIINVTIHLFIYQFIYQINKFANSIKNKQIFITARKAVYCQIPVYRENSCQTKINIRNRQSFHSIDKMNKLYQKLLNQTMNNQFQNQQYRPPPNDPRYPPPQYQQYAPVTYQQPPPRNSYQQNNPIIVSQHPPIPVQATQSNHLPQAQNYPQYERGALSQQNAANMRSPPSDNQGVYFPPPQTAGLMSPPQLHQDPHDSTSQIGKISNIHNEQKPDQNQIRDIVWGQQEQNNTFWEQKFFMIYEKFQWFGQRFQMIKTDYYNLCEQLQSVDSEDDWNQLKRHHQEFAEKLQEMFQQLIAVADQNQQLINQRLGQEGESVWERRYHELLSNFKALQEQNNELQVEALALRSQPNNQQENPAYQQLLTHYRALEEEYDKLFNEFNKIQAENQGLVKNSQSNRNSGPSLQDFESMRSEYEKNMQMIQNQYDHLKGQCQQLYEEKEHYREQTQNIGQSNQQVQYLHQAIQQKQNSLSAVSKQFSDLNSKILAIQSQNKQEISKAQQKNVSIIREQERHINDLNLQITRNSQESSSLKKKLQEQAKLREKNQHQHRQEIEKLVNIQRDKGNRQKIALEQQIKALKQQYENLHRQLNERNLNKFQLQSYQNKIKFLKQENQHLHNEIKEKNQELLTLRSLSLQLTTYENVIDQYKMLQKEKLALQEIYRKEHSEYISLRKRLSQVQHDFQQHKAFTISLGSKSNLNSQLKQLQQELLQEKDNAAKSQSQVHKCKQLIQSKDSFAQQIQSQNGKLIGQLEYQSKINQGEKAQHLMQAQTLERRIQTLEKRNKINELEFKKEITENYERQIKELRRSNEEKLKRTKALEEELHTFRSKTSHLEKTSGTFHKEHDLLKKKIESLQIKNNELVTKMQLSKSSFHSTQQHLTEVKQKEQTLRAQVHSYVIQIEQADNLIKSKNNIIVQYQRQVNQFIEKISLLEKKVEEDKKREQDKVKRFEQEIQKMRSKLYGNNQQRRDSTGYRDSGYFQNKYSSSYGSNRYLTFGTKEPPSISQPRNEEIVKLQNSIIEHLNEQNSKLRNDVLQMTKKLNQLQTLSRVVSGNLQQSKKNSPSKSRISSIPQRDIGAFGVGQRLLKFNERLQNFIQDNELISMGEVDLTASQRIANFERQKREVQLKYEKLVRSLNDKIKILEEQLNTVTTQTKKVEINDMEKFQIMNDQTEKSREEELQFLRSKLNEQTKINSQLIKLNEQLKKQLQQSFQSNRNSTAEYYKMQWKESEKNLLQEKQKNKKINQQNKRLKHQNLQHDTKLAKQYELKLFEMELKVKELERENSYLNINRAKGQNERANLLHDVNVYSADVEALKYSMQTKISHYEKVNQDLKDKCGGLQLQIQELNGKLKIGDTTHGKKMKSYYSPSIKA